MPLQLNNLDDDYVEVATTSSVSPELRDQVLGVDDSLQICSIVCSLLIIVGYVFIRTVDKTLDRLSLRLLIYSCFFNIIFGICQLFLNKNYVLADRACDAVMAFFVLSDMATALLLTCIAINLYLHIVHKAQIKASARVLETIYVVGTIILTGFMAITPFFAPDDVYNYNENLRQCWFVTSLPPTPMEIFWQLWLFHLWQLIGVLAALFAFISVIVNLRREEISIDEHIASAQVTANKWTCGDDKISPNLAEQAHSNTDQEHSSEERNIKDTKRHSVVSNFSRRTVEKGREKCIHWLKFWLPRRAFSSHREIRNTAIHASIRNSRNISYVAKTIRQVICYSLVLIITQIFNFASFVDYAAHARYLSIYYILSFVSTGAKGPLLLLCFMIDPALWSAIHLTRSRRRERKSPDSTNAPTALTVPAYTAPKKDIPPRHNTLDFITVMKDHEESDMGVSIDDISFTESEGGRPGTTIGQGSESLDLECQTVECPAQCSKVL